MKSMFLRNCLAVVCVGSALTLADNAGAITITSGTRSATLDLATAAASGNANSEEADIDVEFPAYAPWTLRDDANPTNSGVGTGGLLTVVLDAGSSWGTSPASGTWALAASYWSTYGQAVISIHVGGGPQPPDDHFSFLIKQGETSGTWSFNNGTATGGGLSNLRLFSAGEPQQTPDGGSTVALMGLALSGVAVGRRFLKKA